MTDGPSVETDIWEYYNGRSPGQIVVLGADLFDGSAAQVTQFKNQTGATYPLLLTCGFTQVGDANFFNVYGDRDNYAVINKQGIVRYNAYDHWPYGARYHLDELRGTIDTLLTVTTGVDDDPSPRAFGLEASPNPSRGRVDLALANPAAGALDARVDVFDLAGREVAEVFRGPVPRGVTRVSWDGQGTGGAAIAPGVYLVRARIGGSELTRRVLRVR
ncbi:MAG TPA: FlgD immunoglobulin-like domain containing protein [Candidatus Eisenbacteria bacterium]